MQEEVKQLRLVAGMSVIEFSKALGVSRKTVYDWEGGIYEPSNLARKQIRILAKKLKKQLEKKVSG